VKFATGAGEIAALGGKLVEWKGNGRAGLSPYTHKSGLSLRGDASVDLAAGTDGNFAGAELRFFCRFVDLERV
jgi:hypothetical protein